MLLPESMARCSHAAPLQAPMLLLWGELDPWIGSGKAEQIQRAYPKAEYAGMAAGHCPHDDLPSEFNSKLLSWLDKQGSPS